MPKPEELELWLRIRVIDPPANVSFLVQRGKEERLAPARRSRSSLEFEFPVRVGTGKDGAPNFLGAYAQGPVGGRFVYVNSGTLAGDPGSCWTRRAKVPLTELEWPAIRAAAEAGGVLETEIAGTARDGGPACATVPLLRNWHSAEPRPHGG